MGWFANLFGKGLQPLNENHANHPETAEHILPPEDTAAAWALLEKKGHVHIYSCKLSGEAVVAAGEVMGFFYDINKLLQKHVKFELFASQVMETIGGIRGIDEMVDAGIVTNDQVWTDMVNEILRYLGETFKADLKIWWDPTRSIVLTIDMRRHFAGAKSMESGK